MKFLRFIIAAVIVFGLVAPVYAASVFSDVATTHPAYDSITRIADMGLITGDAQGKYKPNAYIDKFETAKALAKISGYKQTGYTQAEKTFYDKAYEKNRDYLNQYGKTYKKWDTTADRQIAYLLEKEILTPDDLKNFVGIKANGAEGVRALTKEDAAMFVIKAIGKKTDALSEVVMTLYLDDNKISAAARPYVYYTKAVGVFSEDEKNTFGPRNAITKADMAILLDKIFTFTGMGPSNLSADTPKTVATENIGALSANFIAFHETADISAVQLVLPDGTKKLYRLSRDVTISIDGLPKTKADLTEGTAVYAVLNNNEIAAINAGNINTDTTLSEIMGILTQMRITEEAAYITVSSEDTQTEYKINPEHIDIYSLRPGAAVIVALDETRKTALYVTVL